MADQAKITSVDALENFRSHLIVFEAKANRALNDTVEEVRRTREWLQRELRIRWENEIRRRDKKLAQAEQEFLSARLSGHLEVIRNRKAVVLKMQAESEEAKTKLRMVKQWGNKFDSTADPILQRLDDLRQFVQSDLPKATALLANIQKTLEGYTDAPSPTT